MKRFAKPLVISVAGLAVGLGLAHTTQAAAQLNSLEGR